MLQRDERNLKYRQFNLVTKKIFLPGTVRPGRSDGSYRWLAISKFRQIRIQLCWGWEIFLKHQEFQWQQLNLLYRNQE